jgi:hypothetical protein
MYCLNEAEARGTFHEICTDKLYFQEGISILLGDATARADELPIEDILAVEHDIVPFDWAVCSSRKRSIPLASGSHSLAGTCRAARNLPRSGGGALELVAGKH